MTAPFQEYHALLNYLAARGHQLESLHSHHMRCGQGCHSCCLPGLTTNVVEAAAISKWLDEHPIEAARARTIAAENPWRGTRCSFLDATGSCSIYEARPVVCRSHGLPLRFDAPEKLGESPRDGIADERSDERADQSTGHRHSDACPLNFTEIAVDSLDDSAVIDLDKLNMLLAAINLRFGGRGASQRTPLAPSSFLKTE